jgi:signal transduction histidine kinase
MRWGTLTNLAFILIISGILLFMVFRASLERAGVETRILNADLIVDHIHEDLEGSENIEDFWLRVRHACRKDPYLRLVIYDKDLNVLGGCGESLVKGVEIPNGVRRSISVVSGKGLGGVLSRRLVLVDIGGEYPKPAYRARFILKLPSEVFSDSTRFFIIYLALTQISLFVLGYLLFHRMIIGPIRETAKLAAKTAGLTDSQELTAGATKGTDIQTISLSLLAVIKQIQEDKHKTERLVDELKTANEDLAAAQEGLVRSEKLASTGRLAAGVAHEVGNPLQIVMGYVELLNDETDPLQRADLLRRADEELNRIDTILQRLLDFAKPLEDNIVEMDINDLVRDCGAAIEGRKGFRHASIRYDLGADIPILRTEPEKVRQIMVNLIFNSVDALGDGGGVILLSTMNMDGSVEIGVQDNGPGIVSSLKGKIFDPFFTTKAPGQGTGLGLSVCLSLADSINGSLEIHSDGAHGTAAILTLPL